MKFLLFVYASLFLLLSGCVRGNYNAPLDEIKQEISENHPVVNVLTPYWDDGFFTNTGKIFLRTLCFVPTLGVSEAIIGPYRRGTILSIRARHISEAQAVERQRQEAARIAREQREEAVRIAREQREEADRKERERRMEEARQAILKELNALLGKGKADLIAKMGVPTRTFPDGRGGEIYVYEVKITAGGLEKSTTTYLYGSSITSYLESPKQDIINQKLFFFDQSGKLYKWDFK